MAAKKSDVMCIGGNQAFGITHTPNFKTMTTFNNDYSNELLDQELPIQELQQVAAGGRHPWAKDPTKIPAEYRTPEINRAIKQWESAKEGGLI